MRLSPAFPYFYFTFTDARYQDISAFFEIHSVPVVSEIKERREIKTY
jgi:hypothetical protein